MALFKDSDIWYRWPNLQARGTEVEVSSYLSVHLVGCLLFSFSFKSVRLFIINSGITSLNLNSAYQVAVVVLFLELRAECKVLQT